VEKRGSWAIRSGKAIWWPTLFIPGHRRQRKRVFTPCSHSR
jgi:hypothetical protein